MAKILIIDDETIILNSLTALLASENHSAVTATDADSGIQLFREQKPDAVFLDLRLPGKNGIEVLKEIMQIDPKAKVIIITGYPSPEIRAEVMAGGACFFYEKTKGVEELLNALRLALGVTTPANRVANPAR